MDDIASIRTASMAATGVLNYATQHAGQVDDVLINGGITRLGAAARRYLRDMMLVSGQAHDPTRWDYVRPVTQDPTLAEPSTATITTTRRTTRTRSRTRSRTRMAGHLVLITVLSLMARPVSAGGGGDSSSWQGYNNGWRGGGWNGGRGKGFKGEGKTGYDNRSGSDGKGGGFSTNWIWHAFYTNLEKLQKREKKEEEREQEASAMKTAKNIATQVSGMLFGTGKNKDKDKKDEKEKDEKEGDKGLRITRRVLRMMRSDERGERPWRADRLIPHQVRREHAA